MKSSPSCSVLGLFLIFFCVCSGPVASIEVKSNSPTGMWAIADTDRNRIIVGIELAPVEQAMLRAIQANPQIKKAHSAQFRDFEITASGGHGAIDPLLESAETIHLHVSVDTDLLGQNARCRTDLYFYMPPSPNFIVKTIEAERITDCKSGAWLGFSAPVLEAALNIALMGELNRSTHIFERDDLTAHRAADPDWYNFFRAAVSQGKYCSLGGSRGLCLVQYVPSLSSRLPLLEAEYQHVYKDHVQNFGAALPIDRDLAKASLKKFLTSAKRTNYKASQSFPGLFYPAGCEGLEPCIQTGKWKEADLALLGGLLCLAGEPDGCKVLKHAQGADGRVGRSPDLYAKPLKDWGKESPFSGDQFNGVVAYLAKTADKEYFEKWLNYIISQKTVFYKGSDYSNFGYQSCQDVPGKINCVLQGGEWYFLNLLANQFGVQDLIPKEERDPKKRYGYSLNELLLDAATAPAGYRMHLDAVKVWLLRRLGVSDPILDEIAHVLLARQPDNPFHQYLIYGATQIVQRSADAKCTESPTVNRDDWAWQRAENLRAWDQWSMQWDCVFVYRLLLDEPPKIPPIALASDGL